MTQRATALPVWRSPFRDREAYEAAGLREQMVLQRRLTGTVHLTGWWPPSLCLIARGRAHLLARRLRVPLNTGALWVSEGGTQHAL
jgi:hypothetical protein